MNCIGPDRAVPDRVAVVARRRRCRGSRPRRRSPLRTGPRMCGEVSPFASTTAPPYRPLSDSTWPIAASSVQLRWQPGVEEATDELSVLVGVERGQGYVVRGRRADLATRCLTVPTTTTVCPPTTVQPAGSALLASGRRGGRDRGRRTERQVRRQIAARREPDRGLLGARDRGAWRPPSRVGAAPRHRARSCAGELGLLRTNPPCCHHNPVGKILSYHVSEHGSTISVNIRLRIVVGCRARRPPRRPSPADARSCWQVHSTL